MNFDNQQPWVKIHEKYGAKPIPYNGKSLSNRFGEHARKNPNNRALSFYGQAITQGQLEESANRLANALSAKGFGKGSVIGIQMPNLPQYATAFLATSKLGATLSSVSPLYAPPETAYQIDNANIDVMIVLDSFLEGLEKAASQSNKKIQFVVVCSPSEFLDHKPSSAELPDYVDSTYFSELLANASAETIDCEFDVNQPFLLQYTGGTTGKPKGAMLTMANVLYINDNSNWHTQYREGKEEMFCPFPFFHIAGTGALFGCLGTGNSYSILPNPRDIDQLCQHLQTFPPTIIGAVPTLYDSLLNHPEFSKADFSGLRLVATGAAPMTSESRAKLESVVGTNLISDAFGMTETAPTYCTNPPQAANPEAVGIAIPGVDVKIVDVDTGTVEQSFGEPGEIIASGPCVMMGYLDLPEESARALRELNGKTYMYTGDVGFMDEEGYIHVCDRAKDMLIVGGFKVFSVEVEDKLASLDCVALSAVVATPDEKRPGNDIVNLFVQLAPENGNDDEDALRDLITSYCRENMAPYKVPKNIYFIDAIPTTPVGKLDKKVLRDQAMNMIAATA